MSSNLTTFLEPYEDDKYLYKTLLKFHRKDFYDTGIYVYFVDYPEVRDLLIMIATESGDPQSFREIKKMEDQKARGEQNRLIHDLRKEISRDHFFNQGLLNYSEQFYTFRLKNESYPGLRLPELFDAVSDDNISAVRNLISKSHPSVEIIHNLIQIATIRCNKEMKDLLHEVEFEESRQV